jgi:hypothetical protein
MSEPAGFGIKHTPHETRRLARFALAPFSLLVLGIDPAAANQPIYRCVLNGHTTYTDRLCEGRMLPVASIPNTRPAADPPVNSPSSSPGSSSAGSPPRTAGPDYTTPYGIWRGQAQYQAALNGQLIRGAHAVVPLVMQVEPQGRVRGFSHENGCTMLGVAAPYGSATTLSLDVTLSECRYPSFNTRYSGSLALSPADGQVRLLLQASRPGGAQNGGDYFDLKATLRR